MTKLKLINENKRLREENKKLKEALEILSNAYIDLEGGEVDVFLQRVRENQGQTMCRKI
jgi:hypothetical protein